MLNLLMFVGLLGSCDVLERVQSVDFLVGPLSSPNTDRRAEAQDF